MEFQKLIFVILILLICGITDILKQKVYNIVTFPGIVMGFAFNYYYSGSSGLLDSFLGFLVCSVIFIILFMTGGFGAGDVKLMMALGALFGMKQIWDVIFCSVIAGGIMANIIIIKNGTFIKNWKHALHFFIFLIPGLHLKPEPLKKENSVFIPYAYAISVGSLIYILIFQ